MAKLVANMNFNQLEAQNMVIQNLATAPSNPKKGQHYFNTADNVEYVWNGTAWVNSMSQGAIYTEGTGIDISANNEIAIDTTVVPTLAGNNTFTGQNELTGTISATMEGAEGEEQSGLYMDNTGLSIYSEGEYSGVQVYVSPIDGLTVQNTASGLDYSDTSFIVNGYGVTCSSPLGDRDGEVVNVGYMKNYVDNAVAGGIQYIGVWQADNQTDYSSITLPVKKGYMYYVQGHTTIGSINWNTGDRLLIQNDVPAGGTITSADVTELPEPDIDGVVYMDAQQTLTGKTLSATNNTITNLGTGNFASGVIQTTVRPVSTATDTSLASEQAVAEALATKTGKITATNPALTASGGVCTWTITNTLGTADVICKVRETSTGAEVIPDISYNSSTVVVKMNSTDNIPASTYTAVIIG